MNIVAEWASPDFHQTFGKEVEVLIGVIAYGMLFSRERRRTAEILLVVGLIHEALTANRNVPLLALIGTAVAARHIQSAIRYHLRLDHAAAEQSLLGNRPPATVALVLAICAAFFGMAQASAGIRSFGPSTGSALDRIGKTIVVYGSYPTAACAFIEREGFPSTMRMFNVYGDGGFLEWCMPDRPVFIDSRADVYFGKVLEDYRKISATRYSWRDLLDSYGVDLVVVSARERQTIQYLAAPDWALVYVDNANLTSDDESKANTLIFIKRQPQYGALIDRCRRDCATMTDVKRQYAAWASTR
jgi:hypothetical protein